MARWLCVCESFWVIRLIHCDSHTHTHTHARRPGAAAVQLPTILSSYRSDMTQNLISERDRERERGRQAFVCSVAAKQRKSQEEEEKTWIKNANY